MGKSRHETTPEIGEGRYHLAVSPETPFEMDDFIPAEVVRAMAPQIKPAALLPAYGIEIDFGSRQERFRLRQ
jgi:hypothetical protein